MRETFNPGQSARDFRQRYLNSFGFFHTESKRRIMVQMVEIGDSATFKDETGTIYRANAGAGVEFEFIPVPKKVFVFQKTLHCIRRVPARQFSRGINQSNTTLVNVPTGRTKEISFEALAEMLAPPAAMSQIDKWQKGESSAAAMSDQFGINGETLYVYDIPIGTINSHNREIVVSEKLFLQEVKDTVSRLGLGYRVV